MRGRAGEEQWRTLLSVVRRGWRERDDAAEPRSAVDHQAHCRPDASSSAPGSFTHRFRAALAGYLAAMILVETQLAGAWTIDVEAIGDERGFFARWYCRDEFAEHGLSAMDAQGNMSFNPTAGTVRGLHLQRPPAVEAKLLRCSRGAIFDVIVDCRRGSATQWQWLGVELTAENRRALYVPEGFAHGYQTLTDQTEVFYLVSEKYTPGAEDGLRFDDPDLGIDWPRPASLVSSKDRAWPLLSTIDTADFGVDT